MRISLTHRRIELDYVCPFTGWKYDLHHSDHVYSTLEYQMEEHYRMGIPSVIKRKVPDSFLEFYVAACINSAGKVLSETCSNISWFDQAKVKYPKSTTIDELVLKDITLNITQAFYLANLLCNVSSFKIRKGVHIGNILLDVDDDDKGEEEDDYYDEEEDEEKENLSTLFGRKLPELVKLDVELACQKDRMDIITLMNKAMATSKSLAAVCISGGTDDNDSHDEDDDSSAVEDHTYDEEELSDGGRNIWINCITHALRNCQCPLKELVIDCIPFGHHEYELYGCLWDRTSIRCIERLELTNCGISADTVLSIVHLLASRYGALRHLDLSGPVGFTLAQVERIGIRIRDMQSLHTLKMKNIIMKTPKGGPSNQAARAKWLRKQRRRCRQAFLESVRDTRRSISLIDINDVIRDPQLGYYEMLNRFGRGLWKMPDNPPPGTVETQPAKRARLQPLRTPPPEAIWALVLSRPQWWIDNVWRPIMRRNMGLRRREIEQDHYHYFGLAKSGTNNYLTYTRCLSCQANIIYAFFKERRELIVSWSQSIVNNNNRIS